MRESYASPAAVAGDVGEGAKRSEKQRAAAGDVIKAGLAAGRQLVGNSPGRGWGTGKLGNVAGLPVAAVLEPDSEAAAVVTSCWATAAWVDRVRTSSMVPHWAVSRHTLL